MVNDERNDGAGFIGPEPTIGRWGRAATLLTLAFLVGNVRSSAEAP